MKEAKVIFYYTIPENVSEEELKEYLAHEYLGWPSTDKATKKFNDDKFSVDSVQVVEFKEFK